eukprot:TRINITY_DN13814_c0_g1_i1.p1 TRINITY_DN13814_c0_g1~~TRINITY_DN13814_c0_g1_i1.p1  ORF type:complete len:319 (-),score=32.65 TRINITY_DN13814_c0_g1_i1:34-990(-)
MDHGFDPNGWTLGDLPPELLAHIFSFFDHKDLLAASVVCRKFEDVASENFLWRNQVLNLLPTQLTQSAETLEALFSATGALGLKNKLPKEIKAPEWKFHFARALHSFLPDRPSAERLARLIRAKAAKQRQFEIVEIKLAFLGEPQIGRTCHIIHYALGLTGLTPEEIEQYLPPKDRFGTVHARVNADRGGDKSPHRVSLRIWAAHTPPFDDSTVQKALKMSLKGCDGVLVGFDMSRIQTLEAARDKWIPLVRKTLLDVPIVLVGLKDDQPFVRTGGIPRKVPDPEFEKAMDVAFYTEQNTMQDREDIVYEEVLELIFK